MWGSNAYLDRKYIACVFGVDSFQQLLSERIPDVDMEIVRTGNEPTVKAKSIVNYSVNEIFIAQLQAATSIRWLNLLSGDVPLEAIDTSSVTLEFAVEAETLQEAFGDVMIPPEHLGGRSLKSIALYCFLISAQAWKVVHYFWWWCPSVRTYRRTTYKTHRSKC